MKRVIHQDDEALEKIVYKEEDKGHELEAISDIREVFEESIHSSKDGKFDMKKFIRDLKKIKSLSPNERKTIEKKIKSVRIDFSDIWGDDQYGTGDALSINSETERVLGIITRTILGIRSMKEILGELHNCMILEQQDGKISFVLEPSDRLMNMLGIQNQSANTSLNVKNYFLQQTESNPNISKIIDVMEAEYNRHLETELEKKSDLKNELHIGGLNYMMEKSTTNTLINESILKTTILRSNIKKEIEKDPHWITKILDMIRGALGMEQSHPDNKIKSWVKKVAKEVNNSENTRY